MAPVGAAVTLVVPVVVSGGATVALVAAVVVVDVSGTVVILSSKKLNFCCRFTQSKVKASQLVFFGIENPVLLRESV